MNFYESDEFKKLVADLDDQIFSKCDFSAPTEVKKLNESFVVYKYYYADMQNQKAGWEPADGEVCRLYKNGEFIYQWKNIDGHSRFSTIIKHSNGKQYLLFDEDLYGYSVLDLMTMQSVHYIPLESHLSIDKFQETFIWCDPYYDSESNLLAVEGCFWASPYSVIVLDFSNPMKIVEANKWLDLWDEGVISDNENESNDIEFIAWEETALKCTLLTIDKQELIEKLKQK